MQNRATQRTLTSRQATNQTMSTVLIAVMVIGLVCGVILAGGGRMIIRQLDREQRQIYLDQQYALLPWKILGQQLVTVVGMVFVLAITAGVVYAGLIGMRWLERQSRAMYARDGLFPIIEVTKGALYDPNRDNAGAHPLITVSALSVQKTAALARAQSNFNIKMDSGAMPELPQMPEPVVMDLPDRIPLRSLVDGAPSIHRLALGVTVNERNEREVVYGDLADMVHVAVGGSSGWGKSVFLRDIGWQLVNAVERPQLAMIDLEGVTLSPFSNSDRLLWPVADNLDDAQAVLQELTGVIEQRKSLFAAYSGVDSLTRYNQRAPEQLAPIVLMIDEATALLSDRTIQERLRTVALRARKYGLWCVLAGQDWKSSSLDTAIRNQLGSRFQFRAMSASQARVLMEQGGAENLSVPGRAQAWLPGRDLIELQTPYISGEMIVNGSGPQNETPAILVDDPNMPDEERIKLLARQGLSKRQIELRVIGYTGGAATARVNDVLGGS